MSLTYEEVCSLKKTSDYVKTLKSKRSFVANQGSYLLIVINYQAHFEKKTTLFLPFKNEQAALREFKTLKDKAKKDIKKNQIALGTYTIDKEEGITRFEIIKGQAGPQKINKRAPRLYKNIFGSTLIASLSPAYDGEGEMLDDSEELGDDIDDDIDTDDTPSPTPPINSQTPQKLDPQIPTLASDINKNIKSLTDKTATDPKATAQQLLKDIPTFLELADKAGAILPPNIASFVPIAQNWLPKIQASFNQPKQEKPSLTANQQRARQLNAEIIDLVKKIQNLEQANKK